MGHQIPDEKPDMEYSENDCDCFEEGKTPKFVTVEFSGINICEYFQDEWCLITPAQVNNKRVLEQHPSNFCEFRLVEIFEFGIDYSGNMITIVRFKPAHAFISRYAMFFYPWDIGQVRPIFFSGILEECFGEDDYSNQYVQLDCAYNFMNQIGYNGNVNLKFGEH